MTNEYTTRPMPAPRHPAARRPVWRWVILGLVLLLIAVVLWIVVRGLIARDQLTGAVPLVEDFRSSVVQGETDGLEPLVEELAARADTAAALTSDPIWRAVEIVPFLGPNLTAFREAAAAVQTVTNDVMPPLLGIVADLDVSAFLPHDGVVDVAALRALEPGLATADAAMQRAAATAGSISTAGTIPQIGEAVDQLVGVIGEADELLGGLSSAVRVLPGMLGADGPRTILLLVQNNAEARATGGIPGAIVEIRTDGGRASIAQVVTGASFGELPEPVLPLTETELALYGRGLGRWMQNVTMTPDFARSAELAAAMWRNRFGTEVDGVASIDPIALSHLLGATGPVTVADGTVLTADDAVGELLSSVYFRYQDASDQDAFFASAAAAVFAAVVGYDGDPRTFIEAIADSVGEHRIYAWSADPAEQAVIAAGRSVAALEPRTTRNEGGIGVYLVDNTGAKMDWYLQQSISAGAVSCPAWGDHPLYEVAVTLTNTAPEDGAGLPSYVTGALDDGRSLTGVPSGHVLTTVYVAFPEGSAMRSVERAGVGWAFVNGGDTAGGLRVGYTASLAPGETTEIVFSAFASIGAPTKLRVVRTPTVNPFDVDTARAVKCPPEPTAPPTDEPVVALGR